MSSVRSIDSAMKILSDFLSTVPLATGIFGFGPV